MYIISKKDCISMEIVIVLANSHSNTLAFVT